MGLRLVEFAFRLRCPLLYSDIKYKGKGSRGKWRCKVSSRIFSMCLCAENTMGLSSNVLYTLLPLNYSALGASTGPLAHHLHFISEKPLYDFIWSSPAPSVCSTLAKLSKLLKCFSHIWREVPAESRAQNPVRDISPVLTCIWTDTESKEPCQWHLNTSRAIMNLFSDT